MAIATRLRPPRMGPEAALPPLRRSRNVIEEQPGPATAVGSDGLTEDEREPAGGAAAEPAIAPGTRPPAEPLVLAPGTAVVAYDGGPDGRAALGFAIAHLRGPLVIAHVWATVDPLLLLAVPGPSGTAARSLRDAEREHERARREAQRVALSGAAIAQEAGHHAVGISIDAPSGTPPLEVVARWAERSGAAQLVVSAGRSGRRWRPLRATACERLLRLASCSLTVVPSEPVPRPRSRRDAPLPIRPDCGSIRDAPLLAPSRRIVCPGMACVRSCEAPGHGAVPLAPGDRLEGWS